MRERQRRNHQALHRLRRPFREIAAVDHGVFHVGEKIPHVQFEHALPVARRQGLGALHRQGDRIFVEIRHAYAPAVVRAALDLAMSEDHHDAEVVAAEFRAARGDRFLDLLLGRALADEDICGDVGRLPALEIDDTPTLVEGIELAGLEHAVVERVADDVEHVVHGADIARGEPAGAEIAEGRGGQRADDRRPRDRPGRQPERIEHGDHALRRHARKFERGGDADGDRQCDIGDGRQRADERGAEQAAA